MATCLRERRRCLGRNDLFDWMSKLTAKGAGVRMIVKDPMCAGFHDHSCLFTLLLNLDPKAVSCNIYRFVTGTIADRYPLNKKNIQSFFHLRGRHADE